MENKKYLDKVVGSIVRGTKIDFKFKRIFSTPFNDNTYPTIYINTFQRYCKSQFGLTEDEILYVFVEWKKKIKEKIGDGE